MKITFSFILHIANDKQKIGFRKTKKLLLNFY